MGRSLRVVIGIVGFKSEEMIVGLIAKSKDWNHRTHEFHICENGGPDAYARLISALSRLAGIRPTDRPVDGQMPSVVDVSCFHLNDDVRVVVYQATGNLGYSGGINVILDAKASDPDWQAFWLLNPDTEPANDALAHLTDHLATGRYGILGARLIYTDTNRIQQYGGRWRWWLGRGGNVGLGAPADQQPDVATVEASLNYASGACMLVSRDFVHFAGRMDERYFLYAEEVDWCLRRGTRRIGYVHDAIVYHNQGAIIGSNASMQKRSLFSIYLLERSGLLLTWKFRPAYIPLVAVTAGLFTLKYLKAGGLRAFTAALGGWAAGLRRETGFPPRFRA